MEIQYRNYSKPKTSSLTRLLPNAEVWKQPKSPVQKFKVNRKPYTPYLAPTSQVDALGVEVKSMTEAARIALHINEHVVDAGR